MRCPRCRRPVRDQLRKCVRCGCDLRRGASSGRVLDRRTKTGPIGPLDDFVLRETSAPVASARRSRAPAPGPMLAFGTVPMTAPSTAKSDGGGLADSFCGLAARGESPVAFDRRGIPPDGVASRSNTPSILPGRAWSAGRLAGLGAKRDFYHGLLGPRLAAWVIDSTLLLGINLVVIYLTLRLANLSVAEAAQLPLVPLCMFLLSFDFAYLIMLTALGGQTIGKMALGIRVERCGGEPVRLIGALTRTAAYAISVLPVGLGLAGVFLHRRRALHDLIAKTQVVKVS